MGVKKILRKMRLLRTAYYKIQFNKGMRALPKPIRKSNQDTLLKLKGAYQGKRCFIIGNGPSLTPRDLDMLQNEYTFASNRIFKIYEQTQWRPTFYCCQDSVVLDDIKEQFKKVIPQSDLAFLAMSEYKTCHEHVKDVPNILWLPLRFIPPKKNRYAFSKDAEKQVIEGLTVTYSCIQLAVHMGFSEIYLLGVDHNYAIEFDAEGNVISQNKGLKNYFGGEENQNLAGTPPKVIEMTRAFISAQRYSKNGNFQIYNATRGGKLEVFKRVEFDGLFDKS